MYKQHEKLIFMCYKIYTVKKNTFNVAKFLPIPYNFYLPWSLVHEVSVRSKVLRPTGN